MTILSNNIPYIVNLTNIVNMTVIGQSSEQQQILKKWGCSQMKTLNINEVRALQNTGFKFEIILKPELYKNRIYYTCDLVTPKVGKQRKQTFQLTTMRGSPWRMTDLTRAVSQLGVYFKGLKYLTIFIPEADKMGDTSE